MARASAGTATHLSDPAFVAERRQAVTAAIDGALQPRPTDLSVVAGRISAQLEFAAGRYDRCVAAYRELDAAPRRSVESMFQRALTSMYVDARLADVEGDYRTALRSPATCSSWPES